MTVESLITQHIDTWTSAVKTKSTSGRGSSKKLELYGVKKLRELILELAVRGKLVPQDPNDEPAFVLLERIAAEKAQLVKDKKIKRSKALSVVSKKEQPFILPRGWVWERLGNIGIGATGKTPSTKQLTFFEGSIPFIGPGQITQNGEILAPEKFLSSDGLLNSTEAIQGDILMVCIGGSIGKAAIAHQTMGFNQQINAIRALQIPSAYLYTTLSTHSFLQELLEKATGSATPIINRGKWEELLVPIAPIDEQHRIVAKVDELMTLCDQLEQQTEASIEAHQLLVSTLLNTLTNSADADELMENWARISDHFDTLFTTEESIEQLKQTILQLAVMGKLVPQDPNDEPASVLLERIAEEKTQLIKEKKIKKQKALPPIADDEKPFDLPNGWEWCRLGDLELSSEAGWSPKCLDTARNEDKWGVLKISAVTWGKYNPDENKELPASLEPREHLEVQDGDFLISRANTAELVAKAVVVPADSPRKLMMSDKVIRFKFSKKVSSEYINLFNNSLFSRNYYSEVAGGTSSSMKNVSREQIKNLLICLPPAETQKEIIDIVGKFYEICEDLKQRLRDSQQTQLQLTDAIVEQAV